MATKRIDHHGYARDILTTQLARGDYCCESWHNYSYPPRLRRRRFYSGRGRIAGGGRIARRGGWSSPAATFRKTPGRRRAERSCASYAWRALCGEGGAADGLPTSAHADRAAPGHRLNFRSSASTLWNARGARRSSRSTSAGRAGRDLVSTGSARAGTTWGAVSYSWISPSG